jgi:hypothetical protein
MSTLSTSVLWTLTEWAVSTKAFRRNKVSLEKKIVAAALCNNGFSYREVARLVGGLSFIATRDAYVSMVTSLPASSRRYRREVSIDGSDVVLEGTKCHLWLARDVDSGEILNFGGSPSGSAEDGARFLSKVAELCQNRPVVRLGEGISTPRGLLNLDLYFQQPQPHGLIKTIGRILRGGDFWQPAGA